MPVHHSQTQVRAAVFKPRVLFDGDSVRTASVSAIVSVSVSVSDVIFVIVGHAVVVQVGDLHEVVDAAFLVVVVGVKLCGPEPALSSHYHHIIITQSGVQGVL